MRARSKTNKVLDIALSEEKIYFPGEVIQGSILVKPKSSMKVNSLSLKFSGCLLIAAKDKESMTLFEQTKTIPVLEPKKVLEVKNYSFPFQFVVPDDLPSAMDFGKNKMAKISYKLTVILDRPMMPESLCPKIEYPVLVMEYVDVTRDNFVRPSERQKEVMTSKGKCHAKLSVPRTGFTRGETIPVNIVVNTFAGFVKKESLVIELVRKVKIQSPRNTVDDERVLKSNKFDLNIIGPYNFSQSITSQLLIRTTPPSLCYKEKILRIHYKIRAQVFTENKKKPNLVLELPIVIGTWPRADVPIDDDDDEDIIQNMGVTMISDDEDDDWKDGSELKRHSNSSFNSPTLIKTHNNSMIRRSGSNNSLGSISSWRSQSTSADIRISSSTATSPTSIAGSSVISNHTIPDYQRNTLPPVGFKMSNGYLNRSSSTPDLLNPISTATQLTPQAGRTLFVDPTNRSSYYEQNGHRSTKSLHSIHPNQQLHQQQQHQLHQQQHQQQQHRRIGSDEFNFAPTSFTLSPNPEVPNHTLTFVSHTAPPLPAPRMVTQHKTMELTPIKVDSDSEEDDEDDSDDDLFAIIEKKKRRDEREKRRQRIMYTVTE
ncbi:uncharacterized protein EV154DRAFT_568175 [Mucor mucedo]|uniref:uncharacterized protein n=1 Tax=Mucor mucedo TaxID=29922 RepID=UPI00221E9149|nr:uncharacterized protein EV154DRAFT_568175 [Mucor mucedo]KAI7882319.1 hypothetical protein EV154DRAFT_568175 [Mucor mucedo]